MTTTGEKQCIICHGNLNAGNTGNTHIRCGPTLAWQRRLKQYREQAKKMREVADALDASAKLLEDKLAQIVVGVDPEDPGEEPANAADRVL